MRLRSLAPLAAVIAGVAGCGGAGSRPSTYSVGGVRATIPAGWHAISRPLTGVSSPVQSLVVSSFPFHQRGRDGGCAPKTALGQMPAGGGLLYMFEYRGPTHHDVDRTPARPAHFALDPKSLGNYECMGRSYMVRFRDHARVFQAHIYLGNHATADTRRRVLHVLDSLKIRPARGRDAAVWFSPDSVLSQSPDVAVSCRIGNAFACDRMGIAVWLRTPARAVTATVDGRSVRLDDPRWSGPSHNGQRRMFAGFLHPAGFLHGPHALHPVGGGNRWVGRPPVKLGLGLLIERTPRSYVRTSLVTQLAPGWG